MGQCRLCGQGSLTVSSRLGVCLHCIREQPESALAVTDAVHAETRSRFSLPAKPPRNSRGIRCGMCANDCRICVDEKGFCGLVYNVEGKLVRMGGTSERGILEWYYDPLPTNCVAWWFCPGCTGAGYPKYSYKQTAEMGYSNLAVFYGACSYDCLYCQNWHYRELASKLQPQITSESLAQKADSHVSCICYFGGDPSAQMPHAIKTSQLALEKAENEKRILRICWETNGYEREDLLLKAAEFSFRSGGNLKFDLKTWNENLNLALCGVSNAATLRSFRMIGEKYFKQRPDLPVLTASTLLVPGYVDVEEVEHISGFIAEIDPNIPYTLLAFCPQYVMNDLPTTSRQLANHCYEAAKKHLNRVRIGNVNLLS